MASDASEFHASRGTLLTTPVIDFGETADADSLNVAVAAGVLLFNRPSP